MTQLELYLDKYSRINELVYDKYESFGYENEDTFIEDLNNSSTISLDDLKSIQGEGNVPKRSRRKTKSDKNTISLDL